jgi:hypothetical protein
MPLPMNGIVCTFLPLSHFICTRRRSRDHQYPLFVQTVLFNAFADRVLEALTTNTYLLLQVQKLNNRLRSSFNGAKEQT